eukprot:TRINITY_DN56970_c0_g1_i1.p1 TRINITY_DN56970_c0_g1~~TRINITY_DN56970_c0_g1_i1.p1  ORF type:complete len:580 (+),score=53.69 TRINITY_DN56970_c0_g1_i1:46-1740(+)
MPENIGNPACWAGSFTYERCCAADYGPTGNTECWDSVYTFGNCCLEVVYNASCWEDARTNLEASADPAARDPRISNEVNLASACCHPSEYISQLCWGAGRPGGAGMVVDAPRGTTLSFTDRYVSCCFPRLRYLLKRGKLPNWMAAQQLHDLSTWESRGRTVRSEDLDAFEAAQHAAGRGNAFCRFRVSRNDGVEHCDFGASGYSHMLDTLRDALHVLRLLTDLPDVEFVVNVAESLCTDDHGSQVGLASPNITVPVLAQAQPEGCGGVLMPWWAYISQNWTRTLAERIMKANTQWPWKKKKARLFWRGSDTGCLLPGACGFPPERARPPANIASPKRRRPRRPTCHCASWTRDSWLQFPRSKLTLFSMLIPDQVDAKFTKAVVHHDCTGVFEASSVKVNKLVPPEEHLRFRYLMYIDGTSFSDRLYWLLLTNSLVFRAESQLRVWLDGGLRPWVHYVPVAEDLTDLSTRLAWATGPPPCGVGCDRTVQAGGGGSASANAVVADRGLTVAEVMSATAGRFAAEHLSLQASLYYLYRLLLRLAALSSPSNSPGFQHNKRRAAVRKR